MLRSKTIAVVVPAYNEEKQISLVLSTMPDFVDRIIVVDDCSTDKTSEEALRYSSKLGKRPILVSSGVDKNTIYSRANEIIREYNKQELKLFIDSEVFQHNEDRLVVIRLKKNGGVGAAIARGYKWAKDNDIDCTAVMAGDGQMDPNELEGICMPVVAEDIDYVKGNRLTHKSARYLMPRHRFLGNSILSILTKIASGYWHVSDTQTGYTAISNRALNRIELYRIYKRYGMPNDMLVKLNIAFCSLKEVDIKPVYNIGEQSKMKVWKIIPKISWLLFRSFFGRLWVKYLYKSFHPLFILYHIAFILLVISVPFGIKIIRLAFSGVDANPVTVLAFAFLAITGFQSLLFAMWMDMQDNERLFH